MEKTQGTVSQKKLLFIINSDADSRRPAKKCATKPVEAATHRLARGDTADARRRGENVTLNPSTQADGQID